MTPTPIRVLVCGGRNYKDAPTVYWQLGKLHRERPFSAVITGGAWGVDKIAEHWAARNALPCDVYEANWKTHGKAAGPKRNQRMLKESKPDLVVAFPGGRGTADMVRRAKTAGIDVIDVDSSEPR